MALLLNPLMQWQFLVAHLLVQVLVVVIAVGVVVMLVLRNVVVIAEVVV
jgi:hypothetical protein